MILKKNLIIREFSNRKRENIPYIIDAISPDFISPDFSSTLCFSKKDLEKYGIIPSLDLAGKKLNVMLESREMQRGIGMTITDLTSDDLRIYTLEKRETQKRVGLGHDPEQGGPCFRLHEKAVYSVHLTNKSMSASRGVEIPSPSYNFQLQLTLQEYEELRSLPNNAVMRVKKLEILDK
jgi:hypothetical protein